MTLTRIPHMLFGADYNPEQWEASTWDEDVALMVEAGVNIVTLPVFSWSRLEPTENQFDWGWLDSVINKLWENGVAVDLATATATPPAWLVRKHPEILPVTRDGVRLEFGSRQSYCPSSEIFAHHCARLATEMANRYGRHPGLAMWHVSNEYGDHISRCYCEVSSEHFRAWLSAKYKSISKLNEAWGTTSWGQIYTDFAQICAPSTAPGPINPSQTLDFDRFSSQALLDLFKTEVNVLRQKTPKIPITTNFMSFFHDLDYWAFADAEDVVSDDAYPDPADPNAFYDAALNYSLMRSLKNQPWLLLEQAPSAVSWRELNVPKSPGMMRMNSMQAVAHGSDGVMYFQWRAGRFGTEKFHSAILGHRGTQSRTWHECRSLGNELKTLDYIPGTKVSTPVAMLTDWNNRWALGSPESMPSVHFSWLEIARTWNRSLLRSGLTPNIVRATSPMEDYSLLLVPNAYLVDESTSAMIMDFVHRGGIAVIGPFSGVVDSNDHVFYGGSPGPLATVLGVSVDEFWPIPAGVQEGISAVSHDFSASRWSEWLEVTTAEVIATYTTGELAGKPAITRNIFGAGLAYYISADINDEGFAYVLQQAIDDAGIAQVCDSVPNLAEIVIRGNDTEDYMFRLNYDNSQQSIAGVVVPARDVLITKLPERHNWAR